MNVQYGKLALEAGYKLPIKVCESGAGFYLGTWGCEGPCTRESVEYFKSEKEAETALKTGHWTQRGSVKTAFTNDLINTATKLAQH